MTCRDAEVLNRLPSHQVGTCVTCFTRGVCLHLLQKTQGEHSGFVATLYKSLVVLLVVPSSALAHSSVQLLVGEVAVVLLVRSVLTMSALPLQ